MTEEPTIESENLEEVTHTKIADKKIVKKKATSSKPEKNSKGQGDMTIAKTKAIKLSANKSSKKTKDTKGLENSDDTIVKDGIMPDKSMLDSELPEVSDVALSAHDGDIKEVVDSGSSKRSNKKKNNFKVGQDVVYPLQGVGKITEQNSRNFQGQQVDYYTIYIAATDMTVLLPVEKVNELGLRPIVPMADADQALKSMSDKNEPLTSDWKLRYQNNLDLLKEGGVMDIATVVRSLYHRSKVKELPILERKLYDNALKLMVDEISLALDEEKGVIEDLLHTRLENSKN